MSDIGSIIILLEALPGSYSTIGENLTIIMIILICVAKKMGF